MWTQRRRLLDELLHGADTEDWDAVKIGLLVRTAFEGSVTPARILSKCTLRKVQGGLWRRVGAEGWLVKQALQKYLEGLDPVALRKKFLRAVTGSEALPPDGLLIDWTVDDHQLQHEDSMFTFHTCFNQMCVPARWWNISRRRRTASQEKEFVENFVKKLEQSIEHALASPDGT